MQAPRKHLSSTHIYHAHTSSKRHVIYPGCSSHAVLSSWSLPPQGLLEILSAASEFDELPVRPGEEDAVRKLLAHAPVAVERARYTDPHTKANALLQAHFSRAPIAGDMTTDQRSILVDTSRLLQVRRSPTLAPAELAHDTLSAPRDLRRATKRLLVEPCWCFRASGRRSCSVDRPILPNGITVGRSSRWRELPCAFEEKE